MATIPNGYALPFSGYDPHPEIPGAYSFKPANGGNPILASGPEAERMRSLIDRSAPPDMRTAMAADPPGYSQSTPDVGQPPIGMPAGARHGTTQTDYTLPEPPAEPPVAQPSPPAPTGPQGAPTPDGELPPLPGTTPPAAAAPAAPVFEPSLTKRVAAVDPRKMAANAVAVPTTQSIQTEGGIQDPELRKQMIELGAKQIEAQAAQAEVGKQVAQQQYEQASADKAIATADKLAAIDQAGRASAALDLVKQRGSQLVQHAQDDLNAENAKKVDQYALFKGNTGGQIMAMIGVALGQFGAAVGNTQNIALQQLNKQIDENIQEQREQISRGVAGKTNDLRRIMDQYNLDRDDATNVLKLAYQKKVDAAAAERAALLGTQQAKLQYAAIQPKLMQTQAETMSKVNSDLLGKVQINQQSKMVQPSAGGVRMKTQEELTKEYELAARQEKAKNAIAHAGIPIKEGAGTGDTYTAQTVSGISAGKVASHALEHVAELGGMTVDPVSGEVSVTNPLQYIWAHRPGSPYRKALSAAVPEIVRGQTGAAPTESGQEHAADQYGFFSAPAAIQENKRLLDAAVKVREESKRHHVAPGASESSERAEERDE